MANPFFEHPILNSPYAYPVRQWELDDQGQPTQQILERRRRAEFITPIPKPRKRKAAVEQKQIIFDEGKGLSTEQQAYDPTPIINELRQYVDEWRALPNPNDWQVTPETARLLQHWRHYTFNDARPFFCQIEAAETAIWLSEVAPTLGKTGKKFLDHLANANNDANPELSRLALKLATGAGKTTVMAMLIGYLDPRENRFVKMTGEVLGADGGAGLQGKRIVVDRNRFKQTLSKVASSGLQVAGMMAGALTGRGTVVLNGAGYRLLNPVTDEAGQLINSGSGKRAFVKVEAGQPAYVMVADLPKEIRAVDAPGDDELARAATSLTDREVMELILFGTPEEIRAALPLMNEEQRVMVAKTVGTQDGKP